MLSLPLPFNVAEALKSGFYISGTTGCGKSDIGMYAADVLRTNGAIVITFDPTQDWLSRYPYEVLVSLENVGVRTYLQSIKLDKSTLIDTSCLTIPQTQELIESFCQSLFNAQAKLKPEQRCQYFVIFEEAQTAFPQGALRATAFQNAVRLLTQGRNFKLRIGMVTQFAAMLDKTALRFATQRYFGWTSEFHDRHYISAFIGKDAANQLRYLKSGEFMYCLPTEDRLEKISIQPYGS